MRHVNRYHSTLNETACCHFCSDPSCFSLNSRRLLPSTVGRYLARNFFPILCSSMAAESIMLHDCATKTLKSKRNFLRSALIGVAGAISLPKRLFAASGDKLSKQQAEYQDSPKGIQMCATCTLFVAPRSCKVVEGDISPDGWCKSYAMAD